MILKEKERKEKQKNVKQTALSPIRTEEKKKG